MSMSLCAYFWIGLRYEFSDEAGRDLCIQDFGKDFQQVTMAREPSVWGKVLISEQCFYCRLCRPKGVHDCSALHDGCSSFLRKQSLCIDNSLPKVILTWELILFSSHQNLYEELRYFWGENHCGMAEVIAEVPGSSHHFTPGRLQESSELRGRGDQWTRWTESSLIHRSAGEKKNSSLLVFTFLCSAKGVAYQDLLTATI